MTVFFPYNADPRRDVSRRAIQCALEMQSRMAHYAAIQTIAGAFGLTMKAGLACGPVFLTNTGDPAVRLEHILAGQALDLSAEAEHLASGGDVVVHDGLRAAAGEMALLSQRDGFSWVERLDPPAAPVPLPPLGDFPHQAIETSIAYIHPSIAQRLRDNQLSFINEHRKVTILFAGFGDFDYDHDPSVGRRLQAYLTQVIHIVERYDGYLNKVDMGDKGSKYIIVFGAPIAHENDGERALRCALDIAALPEASVRIGVNTGYVFCGQVGSDERREYTVMGDAVNLSARLMQAAQPGQILVNETTQKAEARLFSWDSPQALKVKGKAGPVNAYPLAGLFQRANIGIQEPQYSLPMVGRQAEMDFARERVEHVLQGQGQILGITAEAGMGKSRLAAEILHMGLAEGLTGCGGECLSHGTHTSYLLWRNLLRAFFELGSAQGYDQQVAKLESALAAVDPGFVARLPLLALPLNLPIPDNDLTRPLDAKIRKESLEALLVACIRHRARQTPLMLVMEDCHWIDSLSNDLLEAVGRNVADVPVLMLVVYRPPETNQIQPRVTRFAHFSEIRLAEFSREEAERLIGLKLERLFYGLSGVPAELVERVTERAQGNPFYIDEMINLIHDRGIDPSNVEALRAVDLPDSLHSLIISRIDQLAEGAKTTLKVASVIGRAFRASWLWGIYPELGTPEKVKDQLAELSKLDITPLDKPEPELEYLFKHIVTREVAYESLAVATRQMLHEQTGLFIERTYAHKLEQFVDWLAYHYGLSQNTAKQREYFLRAGEAAQAAYANQAAIDYYRRLLPLLPDAGKNAIRLKLGQVLQLIG
ncbi:MAG: hypothetical protein EHM70_22680, partial [Chloroflexota bacterium]